LYNLKERHASRTRQHASTPYQNGETYSVGLRVIRCLIMRKLFSRMSHSAQNLISNRRSIPNVNRSRDKAIGALNPDDVLHRRCIMLWTILIILLILWLLGVLGGVGGGLIHLLLVVAVIVLIFNLLTGRRRAI
jgi:hypothetical protein